MAEPGELSDVARALRHGLRSLAKAVAVITCTDGDRRFAMAATAVSELSMDPPSMLICVNRATSMFAPLEGGAPFCINILRADQAAISMRCSGPIKGEERFAEGRWTAAALGVPRLEDAQASFVCRNLSHSVFGTHGVFVGEVVEAFSAEPIDPLVYMNGRYTRVVID